MDTIHEPTGLAPDQLLQAQFRAESAERWARSVTETAADSVVIIDEQGRIHSFNPAAERTFGYRSAEVLGRNVSRLMPEPYRSQHDHYLGRFLATGEKRIMGVGREVMAVTREGREFPAFLSISSFEHEGRTFFTGILRDISELKAKEQALAHQNRLQAFKLSLTHQLRGCHDLEAFGQNLLIALAAETGALGGLFYVQQAQGLGAVAGHGYDHQQAPVMAPGQGLVGRVVRENKFMLLEGLAGFELHTGLGKLVPSSLAVMPLVREDAPAGAVLLSFLTPCADLAELLEEAARHVSFHFSALLDQLRIRELMEATERRSALAEQKRLLEEMLANLHEGVAVFDRAGVAVYTNRRWNELMPELAPEARATVQAALGGESISNRAIELSRPRGYGALSVHPLTGVAELVVALVRDTTLEREEQLRLHRQNEELSHFAHAASHDLKTPLRHISSFVDILSNELAHGSTSPSAREALDIIKGGTEKMRSLINSLLTYAEVGQSPGGFGSVDLQGLVEDLWQMLGPPPARLEIARPLPLLYGDAVRLRQLFQNLLENALKFARPDHAPELRLDWRPQGRGVVIELSDNGIGIPERHRDRVFQIFQRLHSSDGVTGNGVGLAICRRVMEQHEGTIELGPTGPGGGATFVLRFPLDPTREEEEGGAAVIEPSAHQVPQLLPWRVS